MMHWRNFLSDTPYCRYDANAEQALLADLNALTAFHAHHCAPYGRYLSAIGYDPGTPAARLADLPMLSVALFKQMTLHSLSHENLFKQLRSSGTTGQTPSRIYLDRDTATLQSKTLVRVLQHWLGKERRPMLILDHPAVINDKTQFTARGAGIQGIAFMGRQHCYALQPDMSLNLEAINRFYAAVGDQPVLLFGFTFMAWQYVVRALQEAKLAFPFNQGILLHSGGWKKLKHLAVDSTHFNAACREVFGELAIHNFYGFVEQVGSVYVACEHNHFHCPSYAQVIIREAGSWRPLETGEPGIIQSLSLVPRSYPGHSLLTEDRGRILGYHDCPCGRPGTYFEVLGRLPRQTLRGCSDTFTPEPDPASLATSPTPSEPPR